MMLEIYEKEFSKFTENFRFDGSFCHQKKTVILNFPNSMLTVCQMLFEGQSISSSKPFIKIFSIKTERQVSVKWFFIKPD